jgi:hypothetical protein
MQIYSAGTPYLEKIAEIQANYLDMGTFSQLAYWTINAERKETHEIQ